MIVTCPSCETKFKVPAEAIPEAGRKVRCIKCQHVWLQKPEPEDDAPQVPDTPPPDLSPPPPPPSDRESEDEDESEAFDTYEGTERFSDRYDEPSSNVAMVALFVLLILGNAAAAGVAFASQLYTLPGVSAIYGMFDIYDTEGMVLSGLKVTKAPTKAEQKFFVEGFIQNTSASEKRVPKMAVTLKDSNNEVIRSWPSGGKGETLAAGEKVPFRVTVRTKKTDPATIVVDIGNAMQLSRRVGE